ncbi:MAG: hypothetical protein ACI9HK_000779 [Pirellulaceae bacterium]|jgi:hypothetical protein
MKIDLTTLAKSAFAKSAFVRSAFVLAVIATATVAHAGGPKFSSKSNFTSKPSSSPSRSSNHSSFNRSSGGFKTSSQPNNNSIRSISGLQQSRNFGTIKKIQSPTNKGSINQRPITPQIKPGAIDFGKINKGNVRPGTINVDGIKPGTIKPGTIKPGIIKPGTIKPGTIKPGIIKPGTIKPFLPPQVKPLGPINNPGVMNGNHINNLKLWIGNHHNHKPWQTHKPSHCHWWFNHCVKLQHCQPVDYHHCSWNYVVCDYRLGNSHVIEDARWYLGVEGMLLPGKGLGVEKVAPGSPADLAGIKPGHVLQVCNTIPLTSEEALASAMETSNGLLVLQVLAEAEGQVGMVQVQMRRIVSVSY